MASDTTSVSPTATRCLSSRSMVQHLAVLATTLVSGALAAVNPSAGGRVQHDGVPVRSAETALALPFSDLFHRVDGALDEGWVEGWAATKNYSKLGIFSNAVSVVGPTIRTGNYPPQGNRSTFGCPAPLLAGEIFPGIGCAWRETRAVSVSVSVTWSGLWKFPHHVEASPLLHVTPGTRSFGIGIWPSVLYGRPVFFIGTLGNPGRLFDPLDAAVFNHTDGQPRQISLQSDGAALRFFLDGSPVRLSKAGYDPLAIPTELRGSTLHGFAVDTHCVSPINHAARLPAITQVHIKTDDSIMPQQRTGIPPLLGLNISHDATTFSISVDGQAWLQGAPPAFHVQGRWWIAGVNLTLARSQRGTGTDSQLGDYEEVTATWSAGVVPIVTSWRLHPTTGALLFEQSFPQGANDTHLPQSPPWKPGDIALTDDISLLSTAFPRFRTNEVRMADLGFLSFRYFWDLEMHGVGLEGFNRDGSVYGGVPLLLHDRDTLRSVVISPYENFKVAFTAQTNQQPFGADLACGIHGRIRALPVGFSHRTLLFAGPPQQPPGVRTTLLAWGDLLLAKNGKQRVIREASRSVPQTKLGYATATGAYYWYRTVNGKTYEQTMFDLRATHIAEQIPVGWYELDSWFYFKSGNATGEDGGCAEWTARPDIFPSGLPAVQQSALDGLPLMTHCKYFSADNVYQQRFPFLKDTESGLPDNATHALAIPLSVDFWNYIMSQAVHNGVVLWKQDWLASLFELSHKAGEQINTTRNFHVQMGAAAARHGIELQYCMPTTSDIIQTVESPTARFVRLSDDYCTNPLQWKIGRVALIAEALGLVAYKDAFWSQAQQPGYRVQKDECWEGHFNEPNSLLHAAVASLSTGQVAFGDAIGHSNITLIRMTCMDDGVLLRSDRQASAIDATFHHNLNPRGEVWRTETTLSAAADGEKVVFRYLLSANLTAAYTVPSNSTGLSLGGQPHVAYDMLRRTEYQGTSTGSWCCSELTGSGAELKLRRTEALGVGTPVPFQLFVVSPLVHGFALLGEADKFLAVSPQRFVSLEISSDALKVKVQRSMGSMGAESVEVAVRLPSTVVVTTRCEFPARAETGPASHELACGATTGCRCGLSFQ